MGGRRMGTRTNGAFPRVSLLALLSLSACTGAMDDGATTDPVASDGGGGGEGDASASPGDTGTPSGNADSGTDAGGTARDAGADEPPVDADASRDATIGSSGDGPFLEQGGLLVIEAESFATIAPSTYEKYETTHEWHLEGELEGFTGTGYLHVLPDERPEHDESGVSSPRDTSGAELTYPIFVTQPGTYEVWVRGYSLGGESNGVHVGVDGELAGTGPGASNMSGFRKHNRWIWENARKDGYAQPATLELTGGAHTLHVWNRDDGFRWDRLILSLDGGEPSGAGPAESPRGDTSNE